MVESCIPKSIWFTLEFNAFIMKFTCSRMDAVNQKNNNNKRLSKVLSTKLSIDDYNAFVILAKIEYQAGSIKEESTSELLRFTIRHRLSKFIINLNILYSSKRNNSRIMLTTISNCSSFIIKLLYSLVPFFRSRYPSCLKQRIYRLLPK